MKALLPLTVLTLAACSPAEAQQHDGARIIEQLEKADTNNDGAVSRTEFTNYRASQFVRFDRNKDGYITDSDIPRMMKSRLPPEMSIEKLQAAFDADKDGRISQAEFVNGPSVMFDRVDMNKDNTVTKQELEAARAMLANRR